MDRRADAAGFGGMRARSGVRQEVLLDVVAVGLEQHAGAAELTDLLLRPLDHAVTLAALGVHHFAGGSHLEALFSARFGLQLGHFALLWPQKSAAREGGWPSKMLVRALIVLRFLQASAKPARTPPRQPLNQPGDEGWAYGRAGAKWQRRTTWNGRRLLGVATTMFMPSRPEQDQNGPFSSIAFVFIR